MKPICIYHSVDLDGWCSAAIVKKAFPDVELIGWTYGQPIPDIPGTTGPIILVDVCFPVEDMKRLNIMNCVVWIDHHKSAIDDMEKAGCSLFDGRRRTEFAACELTWQFFFPEEPMPEGVRLLGMYDSFRHKGTQEEMQVLRFQYAARAFISDPGTCSVVLEPYFDFVAYINCGEGIYNYLITDAVNSYSNNAYPGVLAGHKCVFINKERFNPINFGIDYHADGYDLVASYYYTGKEWSFSLYNDNGLVDVSEIAKQFGGGGHKGAAGFRVNDCDILKFARYHW